MKILELLKKIAALATRQPVDLEMTVQSTRDARAVEHGGVPASHWADDERPR